jgi:WhiB family redox-sensing transcriptional regulator
MTFNENWVRDAACRNLTPKASAQLFFADRPGAGAYTRARQLCATCPVQPHCLNWALTNPEYGFWGGMNHDERIAERRRRGLRLPSGWAARQP